MKKFYSFLLVLLILLFSSCVSDENVFNEYTNDAKDGKYESAYKNLLNNSNNIYTNNDLVIKNIDLGILSHYAKNNSESLLYLDKAEKLISDYYSKSITQNISSFFINDNVIDYAGEDYEDIYINLFKALTYIDNKDYENALVEIKKFDIKQKELSVKYSEQIEKAKSDIKSKGYTPASLVFHNSAFARYLSMLLYLYENDESSAIIDYKYLTDAFNTQKQLYDFNKPSTIKTNFKTPDGYVRLNTIAFSGLAPKKVSHEMYDVFSEIYISIPEMVKQPSAIQSVKVKVYDEYDNLVSESRLQKLESISNIAIDTFKQNQSLIYFKTLARAITKKASIFVIDEMRDNADTNESFLLLSALGTVSKIGAVVTEQADIRTSRYFPADVSISDIYLKPGIYDIHVCFYGTDNTLLSVTIKDDYFVSNEKINILEAVCLQ